MNEKDLINLIDERIRMALSQKNIITKTSAIVTAVNGNFASVRIAGDFIVIELPNKTGTTLVINDSVYVESATGNLSNAFISEKFGV